MYFGLGGFWGRIWVWLTVSHPTKRSDGYIPVYTTSSCGAFFVCPGSQGRSGIGRIGFG